jgi:hypothetical protein
MNIKRHIAWVGILQAIFAGSAACQDVRVPGLETQFAGIGHHGDPIGAHLGVGSDPDVCRHWQGVARYNDLNGIPFFFLVKSGNSTGIHCSSPGWCGSGDCPGELLVVRMGSRGVDGERMRSNKLQHGVVFPDTVPPAADVGVTTIRFDGIQVPNYRHPGGVQIVENVLVVPLERPAGNEAPGAVTFFDISNPTAPILINTLSMTGQVGVAGATRDPATGKYLFALTCCDSETIEFYQSIDDTNPGEPGFAWEMLDRWEKSELGSHENKWMEWQNMNFLRDGNGDLHLACSANTSPGPCASDWIRLFRVSRNGNSFSLTYLRERHLKLDDPGMGCLAAAGGFYVSPTGQLILYTAEHDNDGPGDTIKMGEFRNYDVLHPATVPGCEGWVEFYEDNTGWNDGSPDRSVILDADDYHLEDWDELDEMGWNDEFDSVRWNLAPGVEVRLYKDSGFRGSVTILTGTGSINVLDNHQSGFGDTISSVQFEGITTPDIVRPGISGYPQTVTQGLACLQGAILSITPGFYNEQQLIDQPVVISAYKQFVPGVVIIGNGP